MRTLWQHLKSAPWWGKTLVGALFAYGLILAIGNIRSCSQDRKDEKTDKAIEAVPVTAPKLERAVDSMKVVLDSNQVKIQLLQKQANEATAHTAAALATLDSLKSKLANGL
ncbi:hypothetical protein BWI93_14625 [Siphonobacter sp. BAB-5385]|uniref:hypothetical protein n=1 Tax=Siphonobacter sp. BAB-5385 TaxID=1864822 RepID=UPI000B9EE03E|nr:hypothetical protein [Siphonobacter sp. BAB-5385]OZI07562.1 hypothetical protein BWI93_14625 [Siphonobacter sp. BAB-5385]